ncbi:MAG: agmatinase family protein [Planctomycetota bacterium]|jgi:agmatinase
MSEFDPNAPALDDGGLFGLPHTPEEAAVVLLPVPWDATTSYRPGTADGPAAIREASLQVDLHDLETGDPWKAGIAMLEESDEVRSWNAAARASAVRVIEAGGVVEGDPDLQAALEDVNAAGGRLNDWVREQTDHWLAKEKIVGLVGGDHSTPFGQIAALAERYPGLGILHIDAHLDLREAYEGFTWSHASIMWNVLEHVPGVERIVHVGIRDVCEAEVAVVERSAGRAQIFDYAGTQSRRFTGESWDALCREMIESLPRDIHVSFDIDGLDPVLCPNTGTPVPGGLTFQEASHLVGSSVRAGRRIVGFDLNEVAPGPEGDEWDGNVGARMLYKLIGWALRSR